MIKRLTTAGVAAFLCFFIALPAAAESPAPRGRAAVLLDGATGQILFQQNARNQNYPASTTKLLTALVAVEHGKLDQVIHVSETAVDFGPDSASCGINAGEEHRLEYLLYGLLLNSGNDCATAIAEGVSNGQPEQFIGWMNETAERLGTTGSHFANPHGLHDPNHYTTALDLALIARGALANPTVQKIASTQEFFWPGKSETKGSYWNHNQMAFYYEGFIGGKTGYTEEAKLTLVSAAERNGLQVIGVVMGEETQAEEYGDMEALLDYGLASFERQAVVEAGAKVADVPVTGGLAGQVAAVTEDTFLAAGPIGGSANVTVTPKLNPEVAAPVTAGQNLGQLEVRDGDRLLGTVPVVAQESVALQPTAMKKLLTGTLTGLKWLGITLGGLLVFRTVVKTTRRTLRRASGGSAGRRRGSAGGQGQVISSYRPKSFR